MSNGGISAFFLAQKYPQYFWSVTGYIYAGENDPDWLESEREEAAQFRNMGFTVEFNEEKGEGHVMHTLDGDGALRLFKQFEQARKDGCGK